MPLILTLTLAPVLLMLKKDRRPTLCSTCGRRCRLMGVHSVVWKGPP